MPEKKPRVSQLVIRIPRELRSALEDLAKHYSVPISKIVRGALALFAGTAVDEIRDTYEAYIAVQDEIDEMLGQFGKWQRESHAVKGAITASMNILRKTSMAITPRALAISNFNTYAELLRRSIEQQKTAEKQEAKEPAAAKK